MFHSKKLRVAALAISLSLCPSVISAGDWDVSLKAISGVIEENGEKYESNPDKTVKDKVEASFIALKMSLASGNLYQAIIQLDKMRQLEPKLTESTLTLSEMLIDSLVEQTDASVKKVELVYKEFAEALMKATKPEDIDQWFIKLQEVQDEHKSVQTKFSSVRNWAPITSSIQYADRFAGFQRQNFQFNSNMACLELNNNKTQTAKLIAQYWQDYLLHKTNENLSGEASSLRQVAQYTTNFNYIPRSKVLILQAKADKAYKKLSNPNNDTTTFYKLTDIEPLLDTKENALKAYAMISNHSSSKMEPVVYGLRSTLEKYTRACTKLSNGEIKRGLYDIRQLTGNLYLGKLARETENKYLEAYLNIPSDFTKVENESILKRGQRYSLYLAKNRSWEVLRKFYYSIDVCYDSNSLLKDAMNKNLASLGLLDVAKNLENAQQFTRAIVAYRQVVSSVTTLSEITTEATESLIRLQKQYPEKAQEAERLSSFSSVYYDKNHRQDLMIKAVADGLRRMREAEEKPAKE